MACQCPSGLPARRAVQTWYRLSTAVSLNDKKNFTLYLHILWTSIFSDGCSCCGRCLLVFQCHHHLSFAEFRRYILSRAKLVSEMRCWTKSTSGLGIRCLIQVLDCSVITRWMILFKEMLRIDLCIVLVVCGRYFSFALYIGFLTVIILLEKNKTMFICVYPSRKQNPSKFLWQGFLIIRFYSIRLTHLSCRTCKQQRFLQGFFFFFC